MDKELKLTFLQRRYTIAHKHMKRCSTSLAIKEMQVKTIIRYHFIPTKMAKIKNEKNYKCCWGCGEIGTRKLPVGMQNGSAAVENISKSLKKLNRITIWPCNSTPRYICPQKLKIVTQAKTGTHMFIAALFTNIKRWK